MFGNQNPKRDPDPIRNPKAGTKHGSRSGGRSQAQKAGRWGSSKNDKPKGWGR